MYLVSLSYSLTEMQKLVARKNSGGLVLYVNQGWFNPATITIKEKMYDPDIELSAASMQPHFIPREFSYVILMYISSKGTAEVPCEVLN